MVYFIIQIQQLQKLVKMKENMKNKFNLALMSFDWIFIVWIWRSTGYTNGRIFILEVKNGRGDKLRFGLEVWKCLVAITFGYSPTRSMAFALIRWDKKNWKCVIDI